MALMSGFYNSSGGINLGQVTRHGSTTVSTGKFNFNGKMMTLAEIRALGYNATVSGGALQVNGMGSGGSGGAVGGDPTSQAAAIAKQNALAAADIQANLVLKQAQAQQEAMRMQNDTLTQDFFNVDRAAIAGLDRLKNRGYDALGDASGQAAALGISMSGTALDNQQYLNTQVMNSFTDYNSQMRTQKNQIQGQIDQNTFAIGVSQASAAIQSDSIKGLAKLQTYRPY